MDSVNDSNVMSREEFVEKHSASRRRKLRREDGFWFLILMIHLLDFEEDDPFAEEVEGSCCWDQSLYLRENFSIFEIKEDLYF